MKFLVSEPFSVEQKKKEVDLINSKGRCINDNYINCYFNKILPPRRSKKEKKESKREEWKDHLLPSI